MDRPLWDRVQELYHSTLLMAHSERSEYVASACGKDTVLAQEVSSLLDADDSAAGFLESPVFELGLKIIAHTSMSSSSHTPAEDLVGKTVANRYLIESELGHGGMGKVYLARDLTLHSRRVVIKVLLPTSLQDPYAVKKFKQEVEALARIDHPYVVSVLGAGELPEGKFYLVMQYVSGKTLRSQIPVEGMDLERAALILQQIGAALEDVHEKKIFHLDLKPENIMLQVHTNGRESVKVVDFGIAKVKDSVVAPSTVNNAPVGTLVYMSPEQLRGGEQITAASDVYSMAVVAYEMITGRRPFNPVSGPQLLEMHREGVRIRPVDLRTNLSTEAQAIILRGLSFDRTDRYQSASEFGDSLSRALLKEGENQNARDPFKRFDSAGKSSTSGTSVAEQIHEQGRREGKFKLGKTQFTVIAIFLVILLGVAVVLWLNRLKPPIKDGQSPPIGKTEPTPEPTPETTQHTFTYSLTVQRMRDNKEYHKPFPSTGQETYESGDKFRLNVISSDPGYLYLFNEGSPEPNGSNFTIIYPTPATNNGSATLGADQWVHTGWNKFTGQPGTENFWFAWSIAPIPQLESAKTEAFKRKNGTLSNESLDSVKRFLTTTENEAKTRYATDKESQQVTVRGGGDVLVRMVRFKHR